jgi:PAS domain S-box-containing protein
VGLIGLAADITERHHAETLLRESEEKFRAIFESTLDGVVLIDATGMIVDCNPEFERQAGRTIEQLKQMRIWELRPAEKVHLAREEFLKVMETGSGGAVSLKFKKPDGNVIHIEIRGRTLCIGGKRYIQSITHDITERRRMEEIQRIGALRYKLLFESSRDALMTLAPPLWKFTGANGATLKLFGISDMAEFTACGPAKLSPLRQSDGGLSEEAMQKMIGIALRCGSHFFEWEHQRMDGKPFSASVLLTRMALGDELFLLSTVRDITEHKSREREIRESQALLRELAVQGAATREAELKHMAREVHDELGQLLTALRMDISLLRIQFGGRDPQLMDKIQGMLSLVDKAIGGVRNVAANLRPPALDMGVVPAILWLGDEFTDRTKIKCKVHVLDGTVELGDQSTLTLFRIVQESLTNVARHALANMVEIRIELRDDAICVEVRDDGQGFDMSVIPAKNSFGLMGMNERALAVGGKVEISSLPLQGTVVSVCIPLS